MDDARIESEIFDMAKAKGIPVEGQHRVNVFDNRCRVRAYGADTECTIWVNTDGYADITWPAHSFVKLPLAKGRLEFYMRCCEFAKHLSEVFPTLFNGEDAVSGDSLECLIST